MGNEQTTVASDNDNGSAIGADSLDPHMPACLNDTVPYPRGGLPYYVGCYVFPLVFVVGVVGNLLNLIVLNGSGMRTKANCFLSAMAVVDLGFLIVMFVLTVAVYDTLARSDDFLTFFFATKITFNSLANALSSSSIWLAVVVTVERLVAIRTPLKARHIWKKWLICVIIAAIACISFLLQLFNFFWLVPSTLPNCFNVSRREHILFRIKPRADNRVLFRYVGVSLLVSPLLQVTLPLVVLVALNGTLLYYLRLSRLSVARLGQSSNRTADNEWKVTVTVLVIVATFLLFNCPSAVVFWLTTIGLSKSHNLTFFANFLVVVNKALNFVLYCMSSRAFRRRLVALFKKHADKSATWWQQQSFVSGGGGRHEMINRKLTESVRYGSPSSHGTRNYSPNAEAEQRNYRELETLVT